MEALPGVAVTGRPTGWCWRKSLHSNPSGNCVELARLPGGAVAARDSRQPEGPILIYPGDAFTAFLAVTRTGRFDSPPL